MTVIHIPTMQDWINLSDVKQSLRGYKETNKDGKYDRAIKKETKYFDYLMAQLHVSNDNVPVSVVAA